MKTETRASTIKNVVNRDQHQNGPDFGFGKQRKYYKYIQIAKGKYFKEWKKDMVFRVNREKIKLEIEIYKKNWMGITELKLKMLEIKIHWLGSTADWKFQNY